MLVRPAVQKKPRSETPASLREDPGPRPERTAQRGEKADSRQCSGAGRRNVHRSTPCRPGVHPRIASRAAPRTIDPCRSGRLLGQVHYSALELPED